MIQEQDYKKIEYYLYNYNDIENIIREKENDLIDLSGGVTLNAWLKGKHSISNTVEIQAISIAENTELSELRYWKIALKKILNHIYKVCPILYKYIVLKYFNKLSKINIREQLKIDFKAQQEFKDKIINFIYKNAYMEQISCLEVVLK